MELEAVESVFRKQLEVYGGEVLNPILAVHYLFQS